METNVIYNEDCLEGMFVMNDPHARDIEKQIDEITDELCKKLSMSEFMVRPVVEETTHKIKG